MSNLKTPFLFGLLVTTSFCSPANLPNGIRDAARKKTTSTTDRAQTTPLPTNTRPMTPAATTIESSTSSGRSREVVFDGCNYNIENVGAFKNKKVFNFYDNKLPDGLYASDYIVYDQYDGAPYNHVFETKNVFLDGDFLNLRVPAETRKPNQLPNQAVSGAEICTTANNILFASVRTNAILSDIPGSCQGNFFYLDDTQEIDIEYLSDPNSAANNIHTNSAAGDPIPFWYSNQAIRSGTGASQKTGPAPWDVTAVHEYRIDWTPSFTAFYIDGQLQQTLTVNVPNKPGSWVWNNWANGDINWSAGPPKQDNVFKIQDITMYYNTTDDRMSC